jgi:hypothetical protein
MVSSLASINPRDLGSFPNQTNPKLLSLISAFLRVRDKHDVEQPCYSILLSQSQQPTQRQPRQNTAAKHVFVFFYSDADRGAAIHCHELIFLTNHKHYYYEATNRNQAKNQGRAHPMVGGDLAAALVLGAAFGPCGQNNALQ